MARTTIIPLSICVKSIQFHSPTCVRHIVKLISALSPLYHQLFRMPFRISFQSLAISAIIALWGNSSDI